MQLEASALPPRSPYLQIDLPYKSTCFGLRDLLCADLLSFSTFHLISIAGDHSRTLCEWYTPNKSLRVPTIKAPVPKARAIFASADRDTSETLSLSDKIGGELE
jgi:hypothetical protein